MNKTRRSLKINHRIPKVMFLIPILFGGVFVVMGIVIAIPQFGTFGIFWTIIASLITIVPPIVMASMNKMIDKGITIDSSVESNDSDIEGKLKQLQSLYEQRLITKEEYEEKRSKIINLL